MDKILIFFETDVVGPKFAITVNGTALDYTIDGDHIVINTAVQFGLNLLTIHCELKPNEKVIISDFSLNGASVRQALYLAFHDQTSSTWLVSDHPKLTIPFGNPISWWLTECAKKITPTLYGTNLYEKFDIYYPESINIDQQDCSQLIKDFMKYNFGFHIVDKSQLKWQNKQLPWITSTIKYDEQAIINELNNNYHLLAQTQYDPKQNKYNQKDSATSKPWQVSIIKRVDQHTDLYTRKDFPVLFELVDRVEATGAKVIHAFVGVVQPYSYVAPHCDDFYKYNELYKNAVGCSQIYIPIGWQEGNYFKFADVGFLPYQQGAYLVNNSDFVHASINLSQSVRYTLGFYCELSEESTKRLTS